MAKTTYQKLLDLKLQEIQNSVIEIEMSLRCCGNCINFQSNNKCKLKKQEAYIRDLPFKCCSEWDFDGLKHEERMVSNET